MIAVAMSVRGAYQPVLADVDRDGRDDALWYAPGTAADSVWSVFADGTPSTRYDMQLTGTYRPRVGDLDGDGWDDLVWANGASATTPVWWSYVPPSLGP
jgi:hypothetical protein